MLRTVSFIIIGREKPVAIKATLCWIIFISMSHKLGGLNYCLTVYFQRQRDREQVREWQIKDFLSIGTLHKCSQQPRLGQAGARSLGLNLTLLHSWLGLKYLSHHLLPCRMHISRDLESATELVLKPQVLQYGMWCPKHLNLCYRNQVIKSFFQNKVLSVPEI